MEKILAIYGGPRRNQNTEILLDKFLEGASLGKEVEVDKVILGDLDMSYCTSCYGCSKTGECVIEDDMTELYKKIKDASIIILASPIYFAGVSALSKIMIDRCQAFWSAKYIANIRSNKEKKKGYFIATAGSKDEKMLQVAKPTMELFFASCDAEYSGDLFVANTDDMPVEKNKDILEKAVAYGKTIVRE